MIVKDSEVLDMVPAVSEDKACARKRRIQLRAQQRDHHYDSSGGSTNSKKQRYDMDDYDDVSTTSSFDNNSPNKVPLRGIKKQARYEPGVPMTRDELAAWRKEARRVRNRESAAASRAKTRDRITQLEDALQDLQNKYAKALQLIAELEEQQKHQQGTHQAFVPSKMLQSRSVSPNVSPLSSPARSPISSPVSHSAMPSLSLASAPVCPILPTSSAVQVPTVSSVDLSNQPSDGNGVSDANEGNDVVHVKEEFDLSSSSNTIRISRPTAA